MKRSVILLAVAALMAVPVFHERAQSEEPKSRRLDRQANMLRTLHHHDPLTRAISLASGEPGPIFTEDGMANVQSDIDFGHYNRGAFTVGIEGGREGAIVDLGSQDDFKKRYGHQETVGKGQGFAGIHLRGNEVWGKHGGILKESSAIANRPKRGSNGTAAVHLGHIYLVRIVDRKDRTFDRIAKMIVVGHRPNESVTIRWVLLRNVGQKQ